MSLILWDYPPYPYLEAIALHASKACSLYLALWKNRDKNNKVEVTKNDVSIAYLTTVHTFKHNLMLLIREGVVVIDEYETRFVIELMEWETQ